MTCAIGSLSYGHVQELAGSITSFTCMQRNATHLSSTIFHGSRNHIHEKLAEQTGDSLSQGSWASFPCAGRCGLRGSGGRRDVSTRSHNGPGCIWTVAGEPSFEVAAKLVGSFCNFDTDSDSNTILAFYYIKSYKKELLRNAPGQNSKNLGGLQVASS